MRAIVTLIDFLPTADGHEDVQDLIKHMTKSSDCVQVRILHAVDTTEFWKNRLKTYKDAIPMLIEKDDILKDMDKLMSDSPSAPEDRKGLAQKLQSHCEAMVDMQAVIPQDCLSKVSTKLSDKVTALVKELLDAEGVLTDTTLLDSLQKLLAASVIAFPMSAAMAESQSQVGSRVAQLNAAARADNFKRALEELSGKATENDEDERRTAANAAVKFAGSVQRHELVDKVGMDLLAKCCKTLLDWISPDGSAQIDPVLIDCGPTLCDTIPALGGPEIRRLFDAVRASATCSLSVQSIQATEDGSHEVTVEQQKETTARMRRALCTLKETEHVMMPEISDLKKHLLEATVGKVVQMASAVKDAVHARAVAKAKAALQESVTAVREALKKTYTHGADGGVTESWRPAKGVPWSELVTVYEAKLKDVDLGNAHDLADERKKKHEDYKTALQDAGDANPDTVEMRHAMIFLQALVVAKTEQAIIEAIAGDMEKPVLRTEVQTATKKLRSYGLQEKAALHLAMFNRAFQVITS
ncbi:unnamed protein product, partial [Prorocentrum cordatum]